jgi:hypothetical protein
LRASLGAEEPPWLCSIDWSVLLAFCPDAIAVVLFDCETSPSLPGLRTRIDEAVLDGFNCTAVASASASWWF